MRVVGALHPDREHAPELQQRHLRHIMGMHPKVTATTFEYPRREDVLRAAGVPDIVDFVRFRQVVFAGHALRSKYNAKAYLTAQPAADRKRGRPPTQLQEQYAQLVKEAKLAMNVTAAGDRTTWRAQAKRHLHLPDPPAPPGQPVVRKRKGRPRNVDRAQANA